jgi:hypothetical protein
VLAWIGARARWVMPAGIVVALLLPWLADLLRPALPALVCLTLGLSMARLDLAAVARAALAPKRAGLLLVITLLLMPGFATACWLVARAAGLPPDWQAALVYAALAPPISSAAGLCLMLGLKARLALEFTLFATALTPVVGPLVIEALVGPAVPLDMGPLALRLGLTVLGGVAIALTIRRVMGPARIAAAGRSFDGVLSLGLVAFFIALFDGFAGMVAAEPARAAGLLALAMLMNSGAVLAVAWLGRAAGLAESEGLGLASGNRTVALYLAVLPPDPVYQLFTALYQIPMSLTPLLGRLLQRDSADRA